MIRTLYASIPTTTFQELGANLFFSITFSAIHSPTNKSSQINGVMVVGWVILAKTIEGCFLAYLKLMDDYSHHSYGKPLEPITWEGKLITSITSWLVIFSLPESWVSPQTRPIALIASIPVIMLRKD